MLRRLGSGDRDEVSVGKFLGDALHEELNGRGVRNVQVLHVATTARDETANTSAPVDDDGTGVTLTREEIGRAHV